MGCYGAEMFNNEERPESWARRRKHDAADQREQTQQRERERPEEATSTTVRTRMFDLKEFFTSVPQAEPWETLSDMEAHIRAKYPKMQYF